MGLFVGAVYVTWTVSVCFTAEASVRITVASETATRLTGRETLSPSTGVTLTSKSSGAGTEPVSRASSKPSVSRVPSTAMRSSWIAGAVLSVLFSTVWLPKVATAWPEVSCSGLLVGLVYRTWTTSLSVTAEARVRVTVSSSIATPPAATSRRVLPTVTKKSPGAGTELSSRAWSKVTSSVAPFTDALWKVGAVALVTFWSAKVATAFPAGSCSGLLVGLV